MDLGIELKRKCCRTSQDPVIRYSVVPVPWRGQLRSKRGGKTSIHFNGNTENFELLLQMVTSVNQLSLYGAVSDMIEELPVGRRAPGKPASASQWKATGKVVARNEQRFEKLSEDQKLSRLCSEAGLRLVEVGEFFYALPSPRGKENQSSCREYTLRRDQEGTRIKGWIQSNVRFGPV